MVAAHGPFVPRSSGPSARTRGWHERPAGRHSRAPRATCPYAFQLKLQQTEERIGRTTARYENGSFRKSPIGTKPLKTPPNPAKPAPRRWGAATRWWHPPAQHRQHRLPPAPGSRGRSRGAARWQEHPPPPPGYPTRRPRPLRARRSPCAARPSRPPPARAPSAPEAGGGGGKRRCPVWGEGDGLARPLGCLRLGPGRRRCLTLGAAVGADLAAPQALRHGARRRDRALPAALTGPRRQPAPGGRAEAAARRRTVTPPAPPPALFTKLRTPAPGCVPQGNGGWCEAGPGRHVRSWQKGGSQPRRGCGRGGVGHVCPWQTPASGCALAS